MFRYTAVGLGTSRRTCGLCFQAVGLSTTRRGGSGGERILDGYTTSRQAQRIEPGPFQPQPSSISDMVDPIAVRANKSTTDDDFLAAESLTGSRYIERVALMQVLNTFSRRPQIRQLAADEAGMDDRVFRTSIMSFRRFCLESTPLPLDLHVLISDIVREARSVDELYAPFIQHARKMYPHLEFMEDLRQISNFREPHQWYAEARGKQRRVVFHAGPTNSGKTYHALKSFMAAKSGVYCGPLKLLVNEIFYKTVDAGQVGMCSKGGKCKFSHDLGIEQKTVKRNIYVDARDDEDTMADWDEDKLMDAIEKKHGAKNAAQPQTAIICKYFLDAVEDEKYGWFWECPNGDKCIYRHALPQGYVLKKDKKRVDEQDKANQISIEQLIDEERAALTIHNPTKVTYETFVKWKKRKLTEKKAKLAAEQKSKREKLQAGRDTGLSGRDLFTFNPEMATGYDDDGADDVRYEAQEDEDEGMVGINGEAEKVKAKEIDASMFRMVAEDDSEVPGPSKTILDTMDVDESLFACDDPDLDGLDEEDEDPRIVDGVSTLNVNN